jgi:hypothetical protein
MPEWEFLQYYRLSRKLDFSQKVSRYVHPCLTERREVYLARDYAAD